jgi:hypothetical protein
MPHGRTLQAILAAMGVMTLTLPVRAGTIAADALPLPNRVATAEMVIVGRVTGIEDRNVMVAPFPGAKNKVEYKIAVVTITEALVVPEGRLAPKGAKTIRLGFVPIPPGVAISPPPFQPSVGQDGCFFLTKHGAADFFVAPSPLNFIAKGNAGFDKDLALVKRCVKILADPNPALKGKGEDRFLAAAMLVARYRTRASADAKTEAIDAEQSKLILQALADADWTPPADFTQLSPLMVLHRLPLTKADGWTPPPAQNAKAYAAYAQQWLRDHADSYRIQRFVTAKEK